MGMFTTDKACFNKEITGGCSSRKGGPGSPKDTISVLKSNVADMLAEFGKKREGEKARMKQELADFTSRLQRFVDDLGKQVIDMRKGFHRERTQMIARMDDALGQFMMSLKNEVAQMKTRSARQRPGSGTSPGADGQALTGQENTQACQKEDCKQGKDDLTRIPGIGSHRENLFNQAGIQSFTQLAQCTPEHLRQILGRQGRLVKADVLIAHAQSMTD